MFVVITGCIFTILHIHLVTRSLLSIVTRYVSLTLLAYHIADDTSLTLEIIADGIGFVRRLAILKDRCTLHHTQRVLHTMSIDRTTIHIHGNDGSSQFGLRIIHFTVSIQMGITVLRKHNGVRRFISYWRIEPVFLLSRQCIDRYGVIAQRVACLQRISLIPWKRNVPVPALRFGFSRNDQQEKQ